ncbi:MAG: 50S ribosomal protein L24 [Candidatus Omnitrophica bacterium]|nr:50S ribosomal protein L24 [Candidatus Omnitrophota bacterium]
MLRIKRDDKVMVISGKEKGKTGKVVKVFPKEQRAIVESVNVIKKAVRKSDTYPQGGYVELEKPIHLSKLMIVDSKTSKPSRISAKLLKDGSKVRISKETGEVI